jgi:glycosyltransferase involved in cell wall biosynthesis
MTPAMRFVYVGELSPGGTCYDRMCVLRELGVECVPVDRHPYYLSGNYVLRKLAARYRFGPYVARFNREILAAAAGTPGLTHVWVDKGVDVLPSTLRGLRERHPGVRLVHYTPDPQFTYHQSRHFRRAVGLYDVTFTTKPFEVEMYRAAGAQRVVLTHQAYDRGRFYPRPPTAAYASDVAFIGRSEAHYVGRIRAVVSSIPGVTVKTWGVKWLRVAGREAWARPVAQGNGIWEAEYPKALCSAKIALGLLSKLIPETTTTRTFEIPACGTFMLAERTPEHQALFDEGKEAEFFGSDEEMIDKIKYYLANPGARERIASGGRERCERSGYSNHDRLGEMLREVEKLR